MRMNFVAFVTCDKLPELTADDKLIIPFLEEKNISCTAVSWSDPSVNWSTFNLIVIRSCWDYYLKIDEFRKWLDKLEALNVKILNSVNTIRWNLDKIYLKEFAADGCRIPQTVFINRGDMFDLSEYFAANGRLQAVLKPAISAGSHDTWIVSPESQEADQFKFDSLIAGKSFILQEFLPEIKEKGEMSFMFFNGEYSHAVIKKATGNDFRVQYQFGGTSENFIPDASILNSVKKIYDMKREEELLYARIDGVEVNGEFVLMEIEMIEPVLYLSHNSNAPVMFASAVIGALK